MQNIFAFYIFLIHVMSYGLDLDNGPTNKQLLQIIQSLNSTVVNLQAELQQIKGKQSIGFYARLTATRVTLGTHQSIEFNEVVTNVGGGYDVLQGHFTAPVAGMYQFVVTIMCDLNHSVYVELVQNGNRKGRVWAHCTTVNKSTTETIILLLDAGDMVWVREGSNRDGDILRGDFCSFSGHILS